MRVVLALVALVSGEFVVTRAESRLRISINPVWRFQLGEPSAEPYAIDYQDHGI